MCDHISIDALVCYGTSLDINFIHQNHRTWYETSGCIVRKETVP